LSALTVRAILAKRVLESIKKRESISAGSRLGVGVSGGADSVALLRLLSELRGELGVVLSVVHVNHKLRGRVSDGDEKFVEQLAARYELPFYVERLDVAAKAKREKANLEDAARRVRYEFFARLITEKKVDRVAVAHTADDQAETVLAHILRGTGLAGLGGIHVETDSVMRPLLFLRRAELRTFLRAKEQAWREDATNRDTARLRARIRKRLMPLLEREFQPAVVKHLAALAEFAREDERFLDWMAAERCGALAVRDAREARIAVADLISPLARKDFNAEGTEDTEKSGEKARALTTRIVRRLIDERKEIGPKEQEAAKVRSNKRKQETARAEARTAQIAAQHVAAVLELARHGENGKTLQLPGGVDVRRERDALVFCNERSSSGLNARGKLRGNKRAQAVSVEYEHQIDFQNGTADVALPHLGCVLRLRVIDWPTNRRETRVSGTVLDRDKLRAPLVLRNWRPGDRLQPEGHQKAHKLKRLFNEKRISRWGRQGWPVLTSGGILVWARGFPAAAGFGASEATRQGITVAEEKS
jgi:tRNA(Ile)-lysidine synthase